MNDKLLTTDEVSEYLSISPHTVEMWRRKKVGPPWHKVGRSVRYRESELLAWVERQRRDSADE